MSAKPFGVGSGRAHFPQLQNSHLVGFCQNTFFVEVDAEIELEQLTAPETWGPQPRLQRGSLVNVMRADNRWYAGMIVWGTAAAYPQMRLLSVVRAEEVVPPALMSDPNRVEYQLGAGWLVIHQHQMVGTAPDEGVARARLAELIEATA